MYVCLHRKSLVTLQMVWSPPLRQTVTAFVVPRKIVTVQYPCHSHLTFWKVLKSLPAHIRGPLENLRSVFFFSAHSLFVPATHLLSRQTLAGLRYLLHSVLARLLVTGLMLRHDRLKSSSVGLVF